MRIMSNIKIFLMSKVLLLIFMYLHGRLDRVIKCFGNDYGQIDGMITCQWLKRYLETCHKPCSILHQMSVTTVKLSMALLT